MAEIIVSVGEWEDVRVVGDVESNEEYGVKEDVGEGGDVESNEEHGVKEDVGEGVEWSRDMLTVKRGNQTFHSREALNRVGHSLCGVKHIHTHTTASSVAPSD